MISQKSDNPIKEPHVVVLGGGFAGLEVCKALKRTSCRITLIDRKNHHLFQPLLYQVATAGLSAADIASPLRAVMKESDHATVYMESVEDIDLKASVVKTGRREVSYDYLVIALGAVTSFFGKNEWSQHTLGLKSLDDALSIRRRVLQAFERAEVIGSVEEAGRLMTVIIIGGGPTGVELAGAFAELKHRVFEDNFRNIDPTKARIILVEAQDRLLGMYDEGQGEYTEEKLVEMGVDVRLGKMVTDVGAGYIELGGDEKIHAANIIWAAGVEGAPVAREIGVKTTRAGRLEVEPDLSLPGYRNVFAVGDIVDHTDGMGKKVPGVAPGAIQMGHYVGKLLRDRIRAVEREERPFVYTDKGNMATIGRSLAIAEIRGMKINGLVAWFLWLFIHLMFLVGFRNRIAVFISWVHAYLTYSRGARIIVGEAEPLKEGHPPTDGLPLDPVPD